MKYLLQILWCISIPLSLAGISQSKEWRGIRPLYSTRADVERLLGIPEKTGSTTWYKAGGDSVGVLYSDSPCQGGELGWNVPAGTVLQINVRPQEPRDFAELNLDESEYVRAYGHVGRVYINLDEGISYHIRHDGVVETVSYIPARKDNRLRCPGFPPYDGDQTQYHAFDEYTDLRVEDEAPRLDNFAIQLQSAPNEKGYIVVYAGRQSCVSEAMDRASRARKYVLSRRGIKPRQVVAVDGGYREVSSTELYIVHNSEPAPTPRPSISSSEARVIKRGDSGAGKRCPSPRRRKAHT
jgi:hypothetical protein